MKIIFKSILLSSVLLLSSCATIISGSRQNVEIASEPTSAKVYINEIGNTPVQKNLKRNQNYNLVLKLDGYETYETKLVKKFNAWYIGNIAFGELIGIIIDPITGAMYKLKPEEINGSPKRGTTYNTEKKNFEDKFNENITTMTLKEIEGIKLSDGVDKNAFIKNLTNPPKRTRYGNQRAGGASSTAQEQKDEDNRAAYGAIAIGIIIGLFTVFKV